MDRKRVELLAPAGNMEKLKAAVHFGADAVYFGGKSYSLRAFADNFDLDAIKKAVEFCHQKSVKAFVTANIFAHNHDFSQLLDYFVFLQGVGVDGVIVSDLGVASIVTKYAPKLDLHISTQANVTNKFAAKAWADLGAKRIVLARELTLNEIAEIRDYLNGAAELEAFVHGAMCISYSGRCLLSNYFTSRDSNLGQCAQVCRWQFKLNGGFDEQDELIEVQEDDRGTYLLNSKDLCLIEHLDELMQAGIDSFKIEGRMKTVYYTATVVNAYRRAIDCMGKIDLEVLKDDLLKTSNRKFGKGFIFGDRTNVTHEQSKPEQSYDFIAVVKDYDEDKKLALIEQRGKFSINDTLQILAPHSGFNCDFVVNSMMSEQGEIIEVADKVQQSIWLSCPHFVTAGDILRRKK